MAQRDLKAMWDLVEKRGQEETWVQSLFPLVSENIFSRL